MKKVFLLLGAGLLWVACDGGFGLGRKTESGDKAAVLKQEEEQPVAKPEKASSKAAEDRAREYMRRYDEAAGKGDEVLMGKISKEFSAWWETLDEADQEKVLPIVFEAFSRGDLSIFGD